MDAAQDTKFIHLLSHVPDPRHMRGQRHTWRVILTVISAAIASGVRQIMRRTCVRTVLKTGKTSREVT